MVRAYFFLCLALSRLLRAARYSKTEIVYQHGDRRVRKHRLFYAPLLVWMSGPLVRVLDTGVRVLSQRDWEEREHTIWHSVRRRSVRIESNGRLVLPYLTGRTLASVLDDRQLDERRRTIAIEWAVIALAEFHHSGFTHGDAMAENVMVDFDAGLAHWFDFETIHDPGRSIEWRRADDVRALLVTCLARTIPEKRAATVELILNVYADEEVTRSLAANFASRYPRSLTFHLAQAGLSFQDFRAIGRLLKERAWARKAAKKADRS